MPDHNLIEKALDTGAISTGQVLIPEIIQDGIREFFENRSPLWNIVQRPRMEGYSWEYKEQNSLPTASFGAELAELPTRTNATYADRSVPVKSIYITGEISGQLQAASRTLVNVVQREINNSARGMVMTLEEKFISADSSVDPLEFDGLNKWISLTVFNDTNGNGTGTDQPLTLAALDTLIHAAPDSEPTHFFMAQAMERKLWSMLQPQVRFVNTTTVDGGFTVPTYQGIPIITVRTSSSLLATRIFAPNMSLVYMPVLEDFTYEELAHTRDSLDYMIKMYLTMVVEGTARNHAKLVDVTSAIL